MRSHRVFEGGLAATKMFRCSEYPRLFPTEVSERHEPTKRRRAGFQGGSQSTRISKSKDQCTCTMKLIQIGYLRFAWGYEKKPKIKQEATK